MNVTVAAAKENTLEKISVSTVEGLRGEVRVPGDKSISHRAIMFGSIADGITEVEGFLRSEDNRRTLNAFQAMGVLIEEREDRLRIEGRGLYGLREPGDLIDAGNSGTTTRLLTGLLAGQSFFSVISGDDSLRSRPMGRVTKPLSLMGATIYGREKGSYAPLAIVGSKLKGIEYRSEVASAQVKSALLLAGLYAEGKTTVHEPRQSRDHTERMLRAFGVEPEVGETGVTVTGGSALKGCTLHIPGDISSAAFFIVAALITPDSDLRITGVGVNPTRSGCLDLLRRMGGDIEYVNGNNEGSEPVTDIRVRSSVLHGIEVGADDIPGAIDEFPILSVAAAVAEGKTTIRGAAELRVKESDRIATVVKSLGAFGADIEEAPDGMSISGGRPLSGAAVESCGDHRIAMSMIIAGLVAEGGTEVRDTGCIETSFPGFMELLEGVVR